MGDLVLQDVSYDPRGAYNWELSYDGTPSHDSVSDFDKHGYRLTKLEADYAFINQRSNVGLRQRWFLQEPKKSGSILDHAFILERKGYSGSARLQLERWSETTPTLNKLLMLKPRWGFSFSIDWVGLDGSVFEILGYGFDSGSFDETVESKCDFEDMVSRLDWDDVASGLAREVDTWMAMDTVSQAYWKCDYIGIKRPNINRCVWN